MAQPPHDTEKEANKTRELSIHRESFNNLVQFFFNFQKVRNNAQLQEIKKEKKKKNQEGHVNHFSQKAT